MISLFKRNKKEGTKAYRREMAQRISGKRIRYVTERINGVEEVIGKDGCISIKGDELIVSTYAKNNPFLCHKDNQRLLQITGLYNNEGSWIQAWRVYACDTGHKASENGGAHSRRRRRYASRRRPTEAAPCLVAKGFWILILERHFPTWQAVL